MSQNKKPYNKVLLISVLGVFAFILFAMAQLIIPILKNKLWPAPKIPQTPNTQVEEQKAPIRVTADTVTQEEINTYIKQNMEKTPQNSSGSMVEIKLNEGIASFNISQESKAVVLDLTTTEDKTALKVESYKFEGFDEYSEESKKQLSDVLVNAINSYLNQKNKAEKIKELTLLEGKISIVYEQ